MEPEKPPASPQAAPGVSDPGQVVLRRLNRVEYCNTLADLLGVEPAACHDLPADGVANGFDTLGAVLTTSPLHVEVYEQAVRSAVSSFLALPKADARRARVMTCEPTDANASSCLLDVFHAFAQRAWRRPVAREALMPRLELLTLTKAQGGSVADALRLGLESILLSPRFLFRPEGTMAPGPLDQHEIATRLSYALWSTTPDDELRAAADGGRLAQPAAIAAQIARMLESPKARALTDHFAGQWLGLRHLPTKEIDLTLFKNFDDPLRAAMLAETQRLFQEFLATDKPAKDLLTANFTYLDARLAKHYGLPAPAAAGAQRVSLDGTNRRGLLTHGSILTLTSHPDRTSAVARGIWVLGKLLCTAPPPPPVNVGDLPAAVDGSTGAPLTMRERLAKHREMPQCAACHVSIDPIGLGLENFDAIGAFRSTEASKKVDAAGQLPDGRKFSGPVELASLLVADGRFESCLIRQLMTYSLGRAFEGARDDAWVAKVGEEARAKGGSLKAMLTAILTSAPATQRAEVSR